jgi:hypothetical protein
LEEAAHGPGGRVVRRWPTASAGQTTDEQELYEQIGRLKMEVEWLKKKVAEVG